MEPVTDHTVVPKSELFHYYVDISNGPGEHKTQYNGTDAAEAMAAWSKGIADRQEYVVLEALRERRPTPKAPSPGESGAF